MLRGVDMRRQKGETALSSDDPKWGEDCDVA